MAERLLGERCLSPRSSVLHLSGLLDRGALAALAATGAGLGSFHPLQTVADPETAGERFRGAFAGVEGDASALAAGERLAERLGMTAVRHPGRCQGRLPRRRDHRGELHRGVDGDGGAACRSAGVPPELAGRIYLPLLHGAAVNLDRLAPPDALTGAIRRGDAGTVAAHLAALAPGDRRLYAVVGLEALALSRQAGLAEGAAAELERLLTDAATGR